MSIAEQILEEIDLFLDKAGLKKFKISNEEVIAFIEEKWQEADAEKYTIHFGSIIIGRMTNEYIRAKDFDNMMRWLKESDQHESSKKHPDYINNYYKGQCCLEFGNEEKALEYFHLSYAENPDYIFKSSPAIYEFFNQHLEHPRELKPTEVSEQPNLDFSLKLTFWKTFFDEQKDLYYNYLDEDGEELSEASELHQKGISHLVENQDQILKNMLTVLLEKYPELQEQYDFEEDYKKDFMPDVEKIENLAELISPGLFYVSSIEKDGYPYIGYSFSCSWDREHGLGFMMHKDRVVEIGDATLAFDFYLAEKDKNKI